MLAVAARADVVVSTLDGKRPRRGISLAGDARELRLHTAEVPVIKLATANVVEIVTVPQPAPPPVTARPFEVRLTDGTRVRGLLGEGPNDTLRLLNPLLRATAGRPLYIPLDDVVSVRRVDGRKIPGAARLVPAAEDDVAYRLSGSAVPGVVERFTAKGVVIVRSRARTVPYDKLAAVFIDNRPAPRPAALHLVARLADGSALVLKGDFTIGQGTLSGESPTGLVVRIPVAQLAALGFMGGSFVHLSDMSVAKVKREPFFPIPEGPAHKAMLEFICPVRLDASPDGRPITVSGRRYFKGIGVRPTTALTYKLDGRFRFFQSMCGIDDEIFRPGYGRGVGTGSVVFQVYADGRKVYSSPEVVRGGEQPQRVRLDVSGVQQLRLVVSLVPAEKMPKGRPDSPELDNAVWARPLLIR